MPFRGLRFVILLAISTSLITGSLLSSPQRSSDVESRDQRSSLVSPPATLAEIRSRGVLRVLMHHDAASYFLFRGEELGFEFELARRFAEEIGVVLEVSTPPSKTPLARWLEEGRGDMAAGVIVAEPPEPGSLLFSTPYIAADVRVITHSDNAQTNGERILADTAVKIRQVKHSRKSPPSGLNEVGKSTVGKPLPKASEILGSGILGPRISAVLKKEILYSPALAPVADSVGTASPGGPEEVYTLPRPARIGWAVRPGQDELLQAINEFHIRSKRSGLRKILYEKYFTSTRFLGPDESTALSDRLSRHDPLIAHYAEKAGFDWRLIAALIFEESRFDPTRRSAQGAWGLMQVRRIAARQVGVADYRSLEGNLEAGVKYLRFLIGKFPDAVARDRLAFALSGYLLGPRRVRDAQRLARVLGDDPNRWEGAVERALPLLEDPKYYRKIKAEFTPGSRAVAYTNAILKRYKLYTRYIPRSMRTPNGES